LFLSLGKKKKKPTQEGGVFERRERGRTTGKKVPSQFAKPSSGLIPFHKKGEGESEGKENPKNSSRMLEKNCLNEEVKVCRDVVKNRKKPFKGCRRAIWGNQRRQREQRKRHLEPIDGWGKKNVPANQQD